MNEARKAYEMRIARHSRYVVMLKLCGLELHPHYLLCWSAACVIFGSNIELNDGLGRLIIETLAR
ncbi:hypothetical protein D3C84_808040 [compost metagenome]